MTAKTDKGEVITARCKWCLRFLIEGKEDYQYRDSTYFVGAVPHKVCPECEYVQKKLEEKKRDESTGVRM